MKGGNARDSGEFSFCLHQEAFRHRTLSDWTDTT